MVRGVFAACLETQKAFTKESPGDGWTPTPPPPLNSLSRQRSSPSVRVGRPRSMSSLAVFEDPVACLGPFHPHNTRPSLPSQHTPVTRTRTRSRMIIHEQSAHRRPPHTSAGRNRRPCAHSGHGHPFLSARHHVARVRVRNRQTDSKRQKSHDYFKQ